MRILISIHRYRLDVSVNRAKRRWFPTIRGTWLPSVDLQVGGGVAVNWFGVRAKVVVPWDKWVLGADGVSRNHCPECFKLRCTPVYVEDKKP